MTSSNGGPPKRRRRRRSSPVKLELVRAQQALVAQDRQEHRAIEMRLRGKGYRDIADELGIAYREAAEMVQGVLKRDVDTDAEKLDELRQLEVGRLDRLWEVYYPRAIGNEEAGVQPNMAAANFCMKIIKRRAEFLGLDREVKGPTLNLNVGADAIRQAVEASQDPETLAALERVAAVWAHGGAVDAEYEELGPGPWPAEDGADEVVEEGQERHEGEDRGEDAAAPDEDPQEDPPHDGEDAHTTG